MKKPKKVVGKIGGVVVGFSMIASVYPQTAQAQFIQRSFLNPSFEQNLTPSTANPASPGVAVTPISTLVNCFIQVDQTSVPGWSTTHTPVNGSGNCPSFVGPGSANLIELWTRNFNSSSGGAVVPPDGNVFAELNAEQNSRLFQNLCLFNNETIQFSVNHRGRSSATVADVASFVVNNQRAVQFATANDGVPNSTTPFTPTNVTSIATIAPAAVGGGWVRHSGSLQYTGASGNVPVGFEAISTAAVPTNLTVGNFIDNPQFAGRPVIEFSASSGGAAEAETSPTSNPPRIRVVGIVPAGGIVVPISIGAGSTAILGTDFNTPTGTSNFTVTIPAGNYDGSNATSTFLIPFTIIQDGTTEGNETIVFQIGSSSNYFISSTTACGALPIPNSTYTVFDDEFLSGNVFNDLDNSANGTFTNIQTGSEVGTSAGGLNAILVSSTGIVLATTPVNANGTYIFTDVPFNQSNVTIRLSTGVGALGATAPAASLPVGWTNTSPLVTAPFNTGMNITGKDFGIRRTNPNLLLVKRITAINGASVTGFVDGANTATSDDNDPTWPGSPNSPQYLRGGIDCTPASPCNGISSVAPGGLIEYTIYFLSNGTGAARNIQLCDRIPANTVFQPNTYGVGNGILLGWNTTGGALPLPDPVNSTVGAGKVALSNIPDTDAGQFLATNVSLTNSPTPCNDGVSNPDGALLVRLGATTDVPNATVSGTPTNSYGFIRFQVRVK